MNLLEQLIAPLEKLINERGSAALMKERLDFIKAKLADQESSNAQLQLENEKLKTKAAEQETQINAMRHQLETLTRGANTGICCDHCGNPAVRRTGSRPDPVFGRLGAKEAIFTCDHCGKTTFVSMDPGKC